MISVLILGQVAASPTGVQARLDQQAAQAHMWLNKGVDWAIDKGPGVLAAIVLLIGAWIVSSWLRSVVVKALLRAHVELTLSKFLANVIRWIVIGFGVVTCLGTLGINTTSLAAVVGATGLAVGLALQGSLGNLAAGVLLLIFRPFKVGDSVVVNGQAGTVDGIDLFTTYLDTADNRRIIMPNGSIFGNTIENITRHPIRRTDFMIFVEHGAGIAATRSALNKAIDRTIKEAPGALTTPAPAVALLDLAPQGVQWAMRLWADGSQIGAVRERLIENVREALDEADIAMAALKLDYWQTGRVKGPADYPVRIPAIAPMADPAALEAAIQARTMPHPSKSKPSGGAKG